MPDCTITLSISKTGSADALGFLFHVLVDGQAIATNQSLSPNQTKQVRQLSHQFNEQFESRYQPQVTNENLTAIQPIGRAMNQTRQAIRKTCEDMGYPVWTLPVLYAATSQTHLFDPQKYEKPRRPNLRLQPLPGIIEEYTEAGGGNAGGTESLV